MKLLSLYAIAVMLVFCDLCELGFCSDDELILNGIEDIDETFENPLHVESLARFAVQQHNKQQNSKLEFSRVLKAKQQVVAGKLYYLTLETIDAGKKKTYEAKVWVKPWMNFQQLEEFKLAPSKLGIEQGDR